MKRALGWIDAFRELGEAILEVLRAEYSVLAEDWARFGRRVGVAAALVGGALVAAFWLVALLLLAAVDFLGRWLPLWQAALVVAAALLLAIGAALGVAYTLYRRLESPAASARRRFGDHVEWWQKRLLVEEAAAGGEDDDEEL